jgi:hypothetical protein
MNPASSKGPHLRIAGLKAFYFIVEPAAIDGVAAGKDFVEYALVFRHRYRRRSGPNAK